MSRPDDIVAYTFRAENLCPTCVKRDVVGHQRAARMWAEDVLDLAADEQGIDRDDESSFDSGDFPKVVFRDQLLVGECCCRCFDRLDEQIAQNRRTP